MRSPPSPHQPPAPEAPPAPAAPSPLSAPAGPARRYDLAAIDIDGTLVSHTGQIHPRDIQAIAAARAAGITVCLATGRALVECRSVIAALSQTDPVIVSGGAIVSDPQSGATLERFTMDLPVVHRIAEYLLSLGHPALLLKDPAATGYDYLVVTPSGPDALDPASRWWFNHMGVHHRFAPALHDDPHPEHTVRVGAYSANTPVDALAADLHERFSAEVMLQHFSGVMLPQDRRDMGIDSVHIVELFNPLADKAQALGRLASRMGIPMHRTIAIGDQTNDVSMLRAAGLGIAMGNAHPAVLAAASRTTSPVGGGVADALGNILAGIW